MSKLLKKLYARNPRQWVEALVWLGVTLFVVIAKSIYYANAHSLTSDWMGNAWLYPFGVMILAILFALWGKDLGAYGRLFFNTGCASIILYFFLMGVYEMASNYNETTPAFLFIGLAFLLVGSILGGIHLLNSPTKKAETAIRS
jgi:steroid 5-alpha reductase family enzyme